MKELKDEIETYPEDLPGCGMCGHDSDTHRMTGSCLMAWADYGKKTWLDCDWSWLLARQRIAHQAHLRSAPPAPPLRTAPQSALQSTLSRLIRS